MSKTKALAAILVMVGIPIAVGLLLAAAAYGYATQHVHDTWATIQGDEAVKHVSDYDHGTAAIAAIGTLCGVAWLVVSTPFVLLGGTMLANRHKSWG